MGEEGLVPCDKNSGQAIAPFNNSTHRFTTKGHNAHQQPPTLVTGGWWFGWKYYEIQ